MIIRSPKGTLRLKLDVPADVPCGSKCWFGDAELLVTEVRVPVVHAQLLEGVAPTVSFNRVVNTVEDLTTAVDDYWKPIWGRNGSFQDWPTEDWDAADHILDELAVDFPEISINWQDINQWITIVRTFPTTKPAALTVGASRSSNFYPNLLCNMPDGACATGWPVAERGHAIGDAPNRCARVP